MAREPIPTFYFVLAVVRLGHRFLLVQERKHDQLWYLPAGRVEPGETLIEAVCREALEESGVPIVPEGIVRIEHTARADGTSRCRVIFVARPRDDSAPKHLPDDQSLRAAWVSLQELDRFPLRGEEVRELFAYIDNGNAVYPLSVLVPEGTPLG
jgi:8-oxo-dGTP pyrophosphatase MutT (NUDIX family)